MGSPPFFWGLRVARERAETGGVFLASTYQLTRRRHETKRRATAFGFARSVGVKLKTELSFDFYEMADLVETIQDFHTASGAAAEHLKLAVALAAKLEAQGLTAPEVTVADSGRLYGVPLYCASVVIDTFAPNTLEILRGFKL